MSTSKDLKTVSVESVHRPRLIGRVVYLFEQVVPDPFALSIGLTLLVVVLAAIAAPDASIPTILTSWYDGVFAILGFTAQMVLMLVTGFVVADAPVVRRGLSRLASRVTTPTHAVLLVFPVVAVAAWLNWALGLVVAAFLSREIGRRTRVDFGWLVAASFSAWSVCNSGLSSPIPLSQATHHNALNFVDKITGHVVPLSDTIFAPFVLVPTILVVVVMAVIFVLMHPNGGDIQAFLESTPNESVNHHARGRRASPAARMERSFVGVAFMLMMGVGYLVVTWSRKGFALDINNTILIFLLIGLALRGSPVAYADAIREGAKQTGSMLLQYPVYGGIMGVMTGTGLVGVFVKGFVAVANDVTLPVWSFLSSLIITFLVPSAGGHWAVQGPFVVPAALSLHASVARTAMGVAMAENVSNMLQPFWAVPIVAMAGIRLQRVMGYTAITFLVSLVIYTTALLVVP
ncbi:TIGR00366 family protein [Paraburkholderia agricolaris]|uniref:TIGR00366 family protein n=1 Tax=Paraburkholderia agricolaris TaxID=2152888 RepID=A0ABW9A017_9BURK